MAAIYKLQEEPGRNNDLALMSKNFWVERLAETLTLTVAHLQ